MDSADLFEKVYIEEMVMAVCDYDIPDPVIRQIVFLLYDIWQMLQDFELKRKTILYCDTDTCITVEDFKGG